MVACQPEGDAHKVVVVAVGGAAAAVVAAVAAVGVAVAVDVAAAGVAVGANVAAGGVAVVLVVYKVVGVEDVHSVAVRTFAFVVVGQKNFVGKAVAALIACVVASVDSLGGQGGRTTALPGLMMQTLSDYSDACAENYCYSAQVHMNVVFEAGAVGDGHQYKLHLWEEGRTSLILHHPFQKPEEQLSGYLN